MRNPGCLERRLCTFEERRYCSPGANNEAFPVEFRGVEGDTAPVGWQVVARAWCEGVCAFLDHKHQLYTSYSGMADAYLDTCVECALGLGTELQTMGHRKYGCI